MQVCWFGIVCYAMALVHDRMGALRVGAYSLFRTDRRTTPFVFGTSVLLALAAVAAAKGWGQSAQPVWGNVDETRVSALQGHHPQWASAANDLGPVPTDARIDQLTLVLSRPVKQQLALEKFLADQQDPASPDYHHWLTPAEVGERFGLSDEDLATVRNWLQTKGLHVNWVAPGRNFVGFGGTAADIGRAFQTQLHAYAVHGARKMSVSSDPLIPQQLAPVIKAVRGLYSTDEKPLHVARAMRSPSPELTLSAGVHFVTPADFAKIYDVPSGLTGYGQTIGIVGRSRVNPADIQNFGYRTQWGMQTPVEVVPSAFGGVDPGPALTAPAAGASIEDQLEATLDVTRAGTVAPEAKTLLVVATEASGGIGVDTQYLVQSFPVPAQVINISFGGCESLSGAAEVSYWDTLFEQASAEGISVFVSSGDAGASGCDMNFSVPPVNPYPNSPNVICSSGYATCAGGTQFNDTGNPAVYWSSSNGNDYSSAFGYIPEGGWNEPLNGSKTQTAASGGGVSAVIATPSWQTGNGVPTSPRGRYTPDISFSASIHDGYFACFAAGSGDCVSAANGSFGFVYFAGTSAAAPDMAGVAALLNQKLGDAQGNLNPALYTMAATVPAAFHDVTVATSGVSNCSIQSPSMCNNSIPSAAGLNGGQAGYLVTAGYDLVTGLGSLDVQAFLDNFSNPLIPPTVTVTSAPVITATQAVSVSVKVNGRGTKPAPTGSVTLTAGTYTSRATTLNNGGATIVVPAESFSASIDTQALTVRYFPDAPSSSTYRTSTGSASVTVNATDPIVTFTESSSTITTAQYLTITFTVDGGTGNPIPTGLMLLTSGTYNSSGAQLKGGVASIIVPGRALAIGTDTLTFNFQPDAQSASIYAIPRGSAGVTVTQAVKTTPTVLVTPSSASITTAQPLTVAVKVSPTANYPTPLGTVTLSSGTYTSGPITLTSGAATITVPASSLAASTDTLTASYSGDVNDTTASGSATITVTAVAKITPTITVTPSSSTISTADSFAVDVGVNGGSGNQLPSGTVKLTLGSFVVSAYLNAGSALFPFNAQALPVGNYPITVSYTPDTASAPIYNPASGSSSITVTVPKTSPPVVVTTSLLNLFTNNALTVNIAVMPTSGKPVPTGTVIVSGGGYTSQTTPLSAGTASIVIPAGSLGVDMDILTATYTPDSASSSLYLIATGTAAVVVAAPGFTLSGTPVLVTAGSNSGNTSTVTVTPSGGFSGSVALAAALLTGPAGAQHLPTLSFGTTSPVNLAGVSTGTATLTITTAAASTAPCTTASLKPSGHFRYLGGGAALACILCFGFPWRRRRRQQAAGMSALLLALMMSLIACGGSKTPSCNPTAIPGTTPGTYSITVTGSSSTAGSTTGTVTLTVQ